MKRVVWALVLSVSLLTLTACGPKSPQKQIAKELDLNTTNGTELLQYDTHSGNGDGTACFVLSFSDETLEQEIAARSDWTPLPLDKATAILAYGQSDHTSSIGPYLTDNDGNALLPQVENGYYCFIDRQAQYKTVAAQPILERSSFNFTLAVYDTDQNILYFCQLDT